MTIELIDPTDGGRMVVEATERRPEIERSELDKLGHSLAFEMAVSIIDSESLSALDDEDWREVDAEGEVDLVDAMRYLELCGLLDRHPERANWVRVHNESEATA
jgi:hypothetical protein